MLAKGSQKMEIRPAWRGQRLVGRKYVGSGLARGSRGTDEQTRNELAGRTRRRERDLLGRVKPGTSCTHMIFHTKGIIDYKSRTANQQQQQRRADLNVVVVVSQIGVECSLVHVRRSVASAGSSTSVQYGRYGRTIVVLRRGRLIGSY